MYDVITAILGNLFFGHELTEGIELSEDIYEEMKVQGVGALPFPILERLSMDDTLRQQWTSYCLRQTVNYVRANSAQDTILQALEKSGIPVVVLKGSSAAKYYPHPELRMSGDIDLLIKPCDSQKAIETIEQFGCRFESHNLAERHLCTHYGDIRIELHNRFAEMDNPEAAQKIDSILYDAMDRAEGHYLPDRENGLVLLQHLNHHLMTGIGLRHFVDWMVFADKYLDEDFLELADSVGIKKLAISATQLCQQYLGLRSLVPDGDQNGLWHYLCESGNFGRKQEETTEKKAEEVATVVRGGANWIKRPYYSGLSHLHLQHRWYYVPFVWLYGVLRYAFLLFREGNAFRTIFHGKKRAEQKRGMLTEIGVTRFVKREQDQTN